MLLQNIDLENLKHENNTKKIQYNGETNYIKGKVKKELNILQHAKRVFGLAYLKSLRFLKKDLISLCIIKTHFFKLWLI